MGIKHNMKKRTISKAKELGYRLSFKPHPNVYGQLQDFKLNSYINVIDYQT